GSAAILTVDLHSGLRALPSDTWRERTCLAPYAVPACFFFSHTATTGSYTLSLHDALPISRRARGSRRPSRRRTGTARRPRGRAQDRKSTRLNSSHVSISYAVFCLKKKTDLDQQENQPIIVGEAVAGIPVSPVQRE